MSEPSRWCDLEQRFRKLELDRGNRLNAIWVAEIVAEAERGWCFSGFSDLAELEPFKILAERAAVEAGHAGGQEAHFRWLDLLKQYSPDYRSEHPILSNLDGLQRVSNSGTLYGVFKASADLCYRFETKEIADRISRTLLRPSFEPPALTAGPSQFALGLSLPAISTPVFWRDMESRFRALHRRDGNRLSAQWISTFWEDIGRQWRLGDGNPPEEIEGDFTILAQTCALRLGHAEEATGLFYWLDLLKKGSPHYRPNFRLSGPSGPAEIGIIEPLCEASASFCLRCENRESLGGGPGERHPPHASGDSRTPKRRGRPSKFLPEQKEAAMAARANGQTWKAVAKILYGIPYPTEQQIKNAPNVLKYYSVTSRTPKKF